MFAVWAMTSLPALRMGGAKGWRSSVPFKWPINAGTPPLSLSLATST
jgi:hypothetical protein